MPRTEIKIMTDWQFAIKDIEPEDKDYKDMILPHDWAIHTHISKDAKQGAAQGFRERWGIGWYRKVFFLSEKRRGYKYYLDFGGIFENSTVWVNGQKAGGRKYGYSSFRLEITSFAKKGDNYILIKVDNTAHPADRWYSGCGIYRTVKWLELEEKHLEEKEIIVHTEADDKIAHVTVDIGMHAHVKGTISDTVSSYHAEGREGKLSFKIKDAKKWSAEEPNLYQLKLELFDNNREADCISMNIGIREILMRANQGMYVNGKLTKLKGVCIHQDVGCRGIASQKEVWKERLKNLKEMGCNSLRPSHHVFSEEFLDLCDEMGFYVYEECFDKWTGGLYGRYFETEWEKDIECMIKRDRNRPSIIIWGVGNEVENQGQESMLRILKMFREKVKEMDTTRPITCALNPHFKLESDIDVSSIEDIQKFVDVEDDWEIKDPKECIKRIKRIAEYVDIVACNYQEFRYPEIHEAIPDKLILGTEVYQYFKGHTHQLQNFTTENPSLVPFEYDYVIGGMIWTGFDYLGESVGYPSKGWSGSCIRTNGERRPSYYIMQSYWSDKPMIHFSVMDYSLSDEGVKEHWDTPMYADHWHFPQFHKTVIPYMIATNCDKTALFLNGKEFFVPTPAESPNRLITGYIPWQPGCIKAVGYIDGQEVCVHEIKTPGPAVNLVFDKVAYSGEIKEPYELILTVRAADEDSTPYFRESTLVYFSTEGDVDILGVDNGNLMSHEPYGENSIHMYHGCASVHIRVNKNRRGNAVLASAEGFHMAKISL